MPLSISGTNCLGSLTNFFTTCLRWSRFAVLFWLCCALCPLVGERLQHDGDRDGTRVEGADGPLAGVGGPAALGEHAARGLRLFTGDQRSGLEHRRGRLAAPRPLLDRVHRGCQGVEQGLVAYVGLAARLNALDRRAEHLNDLVGGELRGGARLRASAQERRPPDGARGTADTAGDGDGDLLQKRADVSAVE